MNQRNSSIWVSFAFAGLMGGSLRAEDWPTRMGPHGNFTVSEKNLANEWPKEGPKLLWENKEIKSGFGSPVVASGKVFIIDRPYDIAFKDKHGNIPKLYEGKFLPGPDVLKCLDKATGKLIWKHEFNTVAIDTATAWNTPAVDGDFVYARGGDGQVRCISVQDGKSLWEWPKAGEPPFKNADMPLCSGVQTAASITICDNMLIVLGGVRGYMSKLVGLDKKTGARMWEQSCGDSVQHACNYTVMDLGTRKALVLFGELADPKTGERLCYYEPTNGGMTSWCQAAQGNLLFSGFPRSKTGHGEGLLGNKFEVKSDGSVDCHEVWRWKPAMTDEQANLEKLEKAFGGPLLIDGYLYVFMGRKGEGSSVYCVDAATGKEAWPDRAKAPVGFISPVYADGKIYYTDMNGTLSMFAADPKAYRLLGTAKVLDRALSSPVISDGCLFSRGDAGGLACFDIRAQK